MEPERLLLDQVRLQNRHDLIDVVFRVNIQVNRLGQIKRENAHDGLCIDDIPAGNQIEIGIKLCDIIYKRFNLINGVQGYFNSFQNVSLLYKC